jgi:hypothetical protein
VDESDATVAKNQTALFYTTYNRTHLQACVRDLVLTCQGLKETDSNDCRVVLCGSGDAGFWCLLAAPAADAVICDCGQAADLDDPALLSPDLFCPGIRNMDTFEGALVLAAPHPLLLHNAAAGFPTTHVRSCYKTLGAQDNLRLESHRLNDTEITAWIGASRSLKN